MIVGFIGQLTSDLITSALIHTWTLSNWQTYVGAMMGGGVGALAAFFVGKTFGPRAGVIAGGAVSGFVTANVTIGLEVLFGAKNYTVDEWIMHVITDTMAGVIAAWLSIEVFDPGLGKIFSDKLLEPLTLETPRNVGLEIAANYVMSLVMDFYYGLKAVTMELLEELFDGD